MVNCWIDDCRARASAQCHGRAMIVCLSSFCRGPDFCVTRLENTAENTSRCACALLYRPVASSLVAQFETLIFAFMGSIP